MLKVAHIQLLPLLTGVQRVSLTEFEFLSDEFDYSVVCKNDGPFSEQLKEYGIPVFFVESLQREVSVVKDLQSLFRLFSLFRKQKFDIVHTHSSKTGFVGRIAARLAGCKAVIHTVHGFSFPAAKSRFAWMIYFLMERIACPFTHKLIVMNREDERFALERLGYRRDKVVFQANGVDTKVFRPSETPPKTNGRSLKVVMVGRLWEQKDPKTLVEAAIKILQRNDKIQFDFIGDGELFNELQEQVNAAGLTDNIRFLGWQSDVANLLPAYDVFVLPSKWEGMPLAILEAMSCGLPVVATNIPGNRDLVADGKDGFLFEIGQSEILAEHILRYAADSRLVQLHSITARKKIESHYDINSRHRNISNLYREMTNQQ